MGRENPAGNQEECLSSCELGICNIIVHHLTSLVICETLSIVVYHFAYICRCSKLCQTAFRSIDGARRATVTRLPGVRGAQETNGLSPPVLPRTRRNSVAEKKALLLTSSQFSIIFLHYLYYYKNNDYLSF